jgi:hypothetical protein
MPPQPHCPRAQSYRRLKGTHKYAIHAFPLATARFPTPLPQSQTRHTLNTSAGSALLLQPAEGWLKLGEDNTLSSAGQCHSTSSSVVIGRQCHIQLLGLDPDTLTSRCYGDQLREQQRACSNPPQHACKEAVGAALSGMRIQSTHSALHTQQPWASCQPR